jgi:hypothetical protein
MFDIIGDVHGHAIHLESLLKKLGYQMVNGAYAHAERKALFVGDLIDRGPNQVDVYRIVRAMVEAGNGLVILGNHEFNAIAWATPDPDAPGEFLRKHTSSNLRQHQQFLNQVGQDSALHVEMIDWFKTLPVYIEDFGLRAVHACWHAESLSALEPWLDDQKALKADSWVATSRKGSVAYEAIENVLKGLEATLPKGVSYVDEDGNQRSKTRTCWWLEDAKTFREALLVPSSIRDRIPNDPLPDSARLNYDKQLPLFIGHYWRKGQPELLSDHIACVDYSIGVGNSSGSLCAYRWNGELFLDAKQFVAVMGGSEPKRDNLITNIVLER